MKYTFVDGNGQRTVFIPDEYIYEAKRTGMSNKEAIDAFIAGESLAEIATKAPVDKSTTQVKSARKRKENPVKRELIASLFDFLCSETSVSDTEIVNPERLIRFSLGKDVFEITLSKKRK